MRTAGLQCMQCACDYTEMCCKIVVKAIFSLVSGCCVFVLGLDQVTSSASSSQNFKLCYCHI